jgi:hypothetical protein
VRVVLNSHIGIRYDSRQSQASTRYDTLRYTRDSGGYSDAEIRQDESRPESLSDGDV